MNKLYIFLIILTTLSCQNSKKSSPETEIQIKKNVNESLNVYPSLLKKVLEAHGGIKKWDHFKKLQYNLESTLGEEKSEIHVIDLKTRMIKITGDGYTLGMNGENVWVAPNKSAFGQMSARFYHNLMFYFFAIPYVLADPGIQYEDLGLVYVEDKQYRALKISYRDGIGDADDDLYIAHFNPDSYKLELLLYTVTYFSGQKHENYNLLKYDLWQEVEGLLVPATFTGYKYENGKIGDKRYQVSFGNVLLELDAPKPETFEMPDVAEIDSLKSN